MKFKLTIFTPAYNRAHTLPKLYQSILEQECLDGVEWLIVDDCSTDNTESLVKEWQNDGRVAINYVKPEKNGGKPRAINLACEHARSPFLFIVDSDDYLVKDIIPFVLKELPGIECVDDINGLGMMRQTPSGESFAKANFKGYLDATNLQRKDIGLNYDCNEVYKVAVLKKYPFQVWPGEIFTPESTVLNAMAADGYKIRWFNRPGVVAEYMEDGMTRGAWSLQRRNPMGYAMLFNSNMLYAESAKEKFRAAVQFVAQSFLGKNPQYIFKSTSPGVTALALPLGIAIYFRRLWQYRSV